MYLATFLVSHMTAVFVLGRIVLKVDTNDAWAAGLPAGMVADASFLITHGHDQFPIG
jgi:hypothetical protein